MSIIDFANRHTRQITEIVDQTFFRLTEGTTGIDRIMPIVSYPMRKLLLLEMNRRPLIGSLMAEDAPVPLDRPAAEMNERLLGNLKIGKGYEYTDRDYELMDDLNNYMQASGGRAASASKAIKDYFFGIAADISPGIIGKHTLLSFKVATTGACTYTDPLTKIKVALTYPGTIAALLPAALTTTARWSQSATAVGLQNLEDHAEAYYDEFGVFPHTIALHRAQIRQLANQVSTKAAFASMSAQNLDTTQIGNVYVKDAGVADLIRERTQVQQVLVFDAKYAEKSANGTVTEDYYLPLDYYCFLEPGNLVRAVVPTIERDLQPGVFVVSERLLPQIPRREITHGVANGVPFLKDSRKVAARKVN